MRKIKVILSKRDFELSLTALRALGNAGAETAKECRASYATNAGSRGKRTTTRLFLSPANADVLERAYREGGLTPSDADRLTDKLAAARREARAKTRVSSGANPAAASRSRRVRHVSG